MATKAPPATFKALAKAVKAAKGDASKFVAGRFFKAGGSSEDRASRVLDKVARVKALGSSFDADPKFVAAKAQAIADIWAAFGAMVDSGRDEDFVPPDIVSAWGPDE